MNDRFLGKRSLNFCEENDQFLEETCVILEGLGRGWGEGLRAVFLNSF